MNYSWPVNNINRVFEVTGQLRNSSITGRSVEVIGLNGIGYTDFWHAVRHSQPGNLVGLRPLAMRFALERSGYLNQRIAGASIRHFAAGSKAQESRVAALRLLAGSLAVSCINDTQPARSDRA